MPGMDGYEVCRKLKSQKVTARIPVIFLTARADTDDVVRGFEAGCVDYIAKPFRAAELLARVNTHIQLKKLRGLLPICMYCHKIRNDQSYWMKLEVFLRHQTGADLSHGICPECLEKTLKEEGWAG
jgi:DNA-binding response OmpR family regulator